MNVKIGLFGFGVVGQGFYHILAQQNGSAPGRIARICVRDSRKPRTLPAQHFTFEPSDILDDPEITHVVEATDRPDEAFEIVRTALLRGKTVISANKKMLADRLAELFDLQRKTNGRLLYEASACGSIPIFRNLEQYYVHDKITGIEGIFNGSTNFILTRMRSDGLTFAEALSLAQNLGFAETDPTLDIDGFDPASKLALLIAHALGKWVTPEEILRFGIRNIHPVDLAFSAAAGRKIRLLAKTVAGNEGTLSAYVLPAFVPSDNPFYALDNEYNGVLIRSKFVEEQLLTGKGAGGFPTGYAVLSDLASSIQSVGKAWANRPPVQRSRVDLDVPVRLYWRCPDKVQCDLLKFREIHEKRRSGAGVQITGSISLSAVAKHRNSLEENGSFIAVIH